MKKPCCEPMEQWSTNHCPVHDSPFECPDWLILHSESSKRGEEWGIVIHDGGSSCVAIKYCPWCGSLLTEREAQA